MNFIKKYDILELSDNKKYTVTEIYKEANDTFLMMLEMNNNEVTNNLLYGKIVLTKNKKYGVLAINDKNEIDRLNDIFKPLFENSTK